MIDTTLFKNIMAEARHNPDLLDSFSPNQFKSKEPLIDVIKSLNILNSKSEIVILGSWYGGILIPAFKDVRKITAIDIDGTVIGVAKNRIFQDWNLSQNIDFITSDVFNKDRFHVIANADLVINTSCEHMKSMCELDEAMSLYENRFITGYFAFQSNNLFDIEGHINCVNSMDEFKDQLPVGATIIHEEEIEDDRGTRYMIIGKL